MTFVSSDLVSWFYGNEYILPMGIPLLLALNFYTIGTIHACYTVKSTLGLFRYGQYILLFTGVINLVLDILLGRLWGIVGIYLATLFARLCTNLWYEPYAVYRYGFHKPYRLYLQSCITNTLVLLAAGVVCWSLCRLCHFQAPVNVLLKVVICTVIPNVIFSFCFHKTEEGRYLLSRVQAILVKLIPGGRK
jgi:O-antigen/teichoic acid export membrane protein